MAGHRLLRTYSRIGGEKFLIVFLVLLASPFWFSLLPLFILSAPMKLIWQKENNRRAWRWVASIWLGISLVTAFYSAVIMKGSEGDTFPISFPMSPDGDERLLGGNVIFGAVVGFNISFVTGLMMLPLSITSYIEAKRKSKPPEPNP